MLCANALPAAGYKAWIHCCACIAVQVHTLRKARRYVQSMGIHSLHRTIHGSVDPCFAHGTIHGLHAQSTDYCTNCGSIDCARQSTDCPDPYICTLRITYNIRTCITVSHTHVTYRSTCTNSDDPPMIACPTIGHSP